MKDTVRINGGAVELLRKQHPKLFRQKTLAPALGICPRTLSDIERLNKVRTVEFAKRMAATLGCQLSDIVYSTTGPTLVPPPAPATQPAAPAPSIRRCEGKQLYPRFDKESAGVVGAAESFFTSANRADRVLVQYQMELPPDLAAYVVELTELARDVSGERNPYPYSMDPTNPRVPSIQERMQWLLTWLKGSDVHVFVCDHTKFLPELDEAPEDRKWTSHEWHAVIAIAPPQEWGETSVDVEVDHGRPYFIDWDTPPHFGAPATP